MIERQRLGLSTTEQGIERQIGDLAEQIPKGDIDGRLSIDMPRQMPSQPRDHGFRVLPDRRPG